jgi:hypothetical protein
MKFQKYQFPIFTIIESLHTHCQGTGDSLDEKTYKRHVAWLRWRVSVKVWEPSSLEQAQTTEGAIRCLALAILQRCDETLDKQGYVKSIV